MLASLEKAEISSSLALQLLPTFFGPNSNQKLAIKRNQDLLKILSQRLDTDSVTEYLALLQKQLESPIVQEHFEDQTPDEEDR
jgi:hypothetical protein